VSGSFLSMLKTFGFSADREQAIYMENCYSRNCARKAVPPVHTIDLKWESNELDISAAKDIFVFTGKNDQGSARVLLL
ncbi:6386_t:CDS:2, partial [Racocetra persica]